MGAGPALLWGGVLGYSDRQTRPSATHALTACVAVPETSQQTSPADLAPAPADNPNVADSTDDEIPGGKEPSDIRPVSISDEMKRSYLEYAMSVIISRALPDIRDGLKPVHRRILYAMSELGLEPNKKHVKSARVVGEVMGKYHPHGNLAIYDALVRLAQDFSVRLPLIDGQGNFGSVDGDPPAAERYTECRLAKVAMALLDDLDKDTVEFRENYDGTLKEPSVLPAKFPNLLVNGAGGIAVGMATNIPPHNLGEVIDACLAHLDNPEISIDELCQIIPGPDFPTGGLILGRSGILSAYHKGRGSIIMRAKVEVEEIRKDREALIVTAIPYQVNKKTLIEKIADAVRDKRIEGIADIWDEFEPRGHARRHRVEARRRGRRRLEPAVALLGPADDLRRQHAGDQRRPARDAQPQGHDRGVHGLPRGGREPPHQALAVEGARSRARVGRPRHRGRQHRRSDQAHPPRAEPGGGARAIDGARLAGARHRSARELIADPRHKVSTEGTYKLSEEQAKAILELRLARLTALGRDEIADELNKIGGEIKEYLAILASRLRVVEIVKNELNALKEEFSTPRKTEIVDIEGEVEDEDLIQREDCVVTVSLKGYVKRVPLATYRAQRRGGKGRSGMSTREEDVVTKLFIASTHTPVLFFSSRGMCYRMKVWRLPAATPQAIGKALVNLLPLAQGEVITSILPLPEDPETWGALQLAFATRSGKVRRNALTDFENINRNGKIAMKLDDGDAIVAVEICTPDDDVLLTTAQGRCIRFLLKDEVRLFKGREF